LQDFSMTHHSRLALFGLVLALCVSFAVYAGDKPMATPNPAAIVAPPSAPSQLEHSQLDQAIAGAWRDPKNVARDRYRHPKATLEFFGVTPGQTVIEISPGGGWYTEILAPLERTGGHYVGIIGDPAHAKDDKTRGYIEKQNAPLRAKLAAHPDVYDKAVLREIDYPAKPMLGPPASADAVLTFRNVHNWVMDGSQAIMFKAFFEVLKPGGTLGVTDHRAPVGAATDGQHGYVTEQQVIDYAAAAGFVLAGKSEINANPKDTKDYPHGVWTLPPTLSQGDVDKDKYLTIGESDRMTLKFAKPREVSK